MTNKRKRAKIGDRELLIIADYALRFHDMQRTKLAEKLQSEIEWPSKAPEVEVLERKISTLRKDPTGGPLEKSWSMATLDDYPISPSALPEVLRIWALRTEQKQGFTIREAKWAAQLSALIMDPERLYFWASLYARVELVYQLIDRPFDSTILDLSLIDLKGETIDDLRDLESWIFVIPGQEGIDLDVLARIVKDVYQGGKSK